MTVQIIITGDNGRQAAVEMRSFTSNVVELFGAEDAAPVGNGVSFAQDEEGGVFYVSSVCAVVSVRRNLRFFLCRQQRRKRSWRMSGWALWAS